MPSRYSVLMFLAVFMILIAGTNYAQEYPTKPVRILTSGIGGSLDFVTRLIAQGISSPLGQSVIVDNRATLIANELLAKAPADGYTLLLAAGSLWVESLLQDTSYDPVRDFAPISLVSTQPNVLVVHPLLPIKSVKELIALARLNPGKLNYGSGPTGNSNHIAGELFNSMAGVRIQRIPYKSIGLAITDLISGQVQVAFPGAGGAAPHMKSGRLKALAVTGPKQSELLPGLPTIAESGVPGYEAVVVNALFAPAKTPPAIINRINRELVRFLRTPETKEKFLSVGSEPSGSSPDELAATRKSEMARMGKVIKDADIRAN